jgi:hypothetical protein
MFSINRCIFFVMPRCSRKAKVHLTLRWWRTGPPQLLAGFQDWSIAWALSLQSGLRTRAHGILCLDICLAAMRHAYQHAWHPDVCTCVYTYNASKNRLFKNTYDELSAQNNLHTNLHAN